MNLLRADAWLAAGTAVLYNGKQQLFAWAPFRRSGLLELAAADGGKRIGDARVSQDELFEFLQSLAADLNGKLVKLPSFPDVVMRIRAALDDPDAVVAPDSDDEKCILLKTCETVIVQQDGRRHEVAVGSERRLGAPGEYDMALRRLRRGVQDGDALCNQQGHDRRDRLLGDPSEAETPRRS